VRVGGLPDSSLVARKLGTLRAQLCASPAYLAARGWPQQPADLARHDWLGGRPQGPAQELLQLHRSDGQVAQVQVHSRASATQVTALHSLCVAGWGVSIVLSDDDRRALADGRLVPVLPDWSPPDYDTYAITARRGEQPAKVRHALELLAQHFATLTI
jgi:DNA-binding transcriptional LysR family regulator